MIRAVHDITWAAQRLRTCTFSICPVNRGPTYVPSTGVMCSVTVGCWLPRMPQDVALGPPLLSFVHTICRPPPQTDSCRRGTKAFCTTNQARERSRTNLLYQESDPIVCNTGVKGSSFRGPWSRCRFPSLFWTARFDL